MIGIFKYLSRVKYFNISVRIFSQPAGPSREVWWWWWGQARSHRAICLTNLITIRARPVTDCSFVFLCSSSISHIIHSQSHLSLTPLNIETCQQEFVNLPRYFSHLPSRLMKGVSITGHNSTVSADWSVNIDPLISVINIFIPTGNNVNSKQNWHLSVSVVLTRSCAHQPPSTHYPAQPLCLTNSLPFPPLPPPPPSSLGHWMVGLVAIWLDVMFRQYIMPTLLVNIIDKVNSTLPYYISFVGPRPYIIHYIWPNL